MKIISIVIMTMMLATGVSAVEDGDPGIFGLEIEKLLNLGSGLLALGLFFVTTLAYRRSRNYRMAFVSVAFFVFALKGFMTAHELFIPEQAWIDPFSSLLNFVIILAFALGVLKK